VENDCISKVTPIETIIHFHVYGRKGKIGILFVFLLWDLLTPGPNWEVFFGEKNMFMILVEIEFIDCICLWLKSTSMR